MRKIKGQRSGSGSGSSDEESQEVPVQFEWPNIELEPDTFGLSICSLVRDLSFVARSRGTAVNRWSRLAKSTFLLVMCLTIQVFLLSQVKRFVSAMAVHDIRKTYDKFQHVMYDGHTEVVFTHPFVERRGIGGKYGPYFNVSKFGELEPGVRAAACHIPLSEPMFFWTVLFIWTLTCASELRKTYEITSELICNTETIDSMSYALKDEEVSGEVAVIVGLTRGVKALIVFLVILPRLGIICFLVWVGCRWLLATNNFSDLILNSVALEFILCLKDVIYMALVPRRSMLDLQNTTIQPMDKKEPESIRVFMGTLVWVLVAAGWVTIYMGSGALHLRGLQQVLRGFQWNVHDVCVSWIAVRYAV